MFQYNPGGDSLVSFGFLDKVGTLTKSFNIPVNLLHIHNIFLIFSRQLKRLFKNIKAICREL